MTKILIILISLAAIQVYGQVDKFPVYKLIDIDSFNFKKDILFLKTVKLTKDTLTVRIDAKDFLFISSVNDSVLAYPIYSSEYDSKYDLEISLWEIKQIENDSVTFKILYTKRHKKNGSQKGNYFVIDNLKIDKEEIAGVYVADESKRLPRKTGIIELALLTIIITGSLLAGPQ